MSTLTTNYKLVKPELTDPANITDMNVNWDEIDEQLKKLNDSLGNMDWSDLEENVNKVGIGLPVASAISTDGASYTATIKGISNLRTGLAVIIVPNIVSTTVLPTLDLNELGAMNIKQGLSTNTTTVVNAENANWLSANKPCLIMYDGTQWVTVRGRVAATDMYGAVAIENGGTGATTASEALTNLGAAPSSHKHSASDITTGTFPTTAIYAKTGTDYTTARIRNIKASTTDLTAGTSTLSSGDIYLVYE